LACPATVPEVSELAWAFALPLKHTTPSVSVPANAIKLYLDFIGGAPS
jgi:hypothetical protein